MIEKFSEEELKQIMKELGIKEKHVQKFDVVNEERNEIRNIFRDRPRFSPLDFPHEKAYMFINGIVSLTLNFLSEKKDGYYKISPSVPVRDESEYKQMFQEILEIIKKHNRKWERDNQ